MHFHERPSLRRESINSTKGPQMAVPATQGYHRRRPHSEGGQGRVTGQGRAARSGRAVHWNILKLYISQSTFKSGPMREKIDSCFILHVIKQSINWMVNLGDFTSLKSIFSPFTTVNEDFNCFKLSVENGCNLMTNC